MLSAGENRARVASGDRARLCVSIGVPGRSAGSRPIFYASYAARDRGRAAAGAAAVAALARLLRPVLKWLRPVEGALAADSLIQAPRRTSATVAALMLSLALVVAFAGMARASYGSILEWMQTALNPDLFVMPSQSIVDPDAPLSRRTMAAELAADARHRARADRARAPGSCSGNAR